MRISKARLVSVGHAFNRVVTEGGWTKVQLRNNCFYRVATEGGWVNVQMANRRARTLMDVRACSNPSDSMLEISER